MPRRRKYKVGTLRDHQRDPNKQASRLEIWKEMASFLPPSRSETLIFPGGHRHECDLLFEMGYLPEHVYYVEKSPAVLAHLTRRSKGLPSPPRSNILRMYLSEAVQQLQQRRVKLDVVHLDFCSHCEAGRMISEIRAFFQTPVLAPTALVAITWLMGREHKIDEIGVAGLSFGVVKGQWDEFHRLTVYDRGRIRKVYEAVEADFTLVKSGHYQNVTTNNPMRWVLLRVKSTPRS